ncbi:MAG: hypothetical protein J6X18_12520 [Bacteroidales bacterium]|nr:hypothetical protein [Bacteroidales bacterium]
MNTNDVEFDSGVSAEVAKLNSEIAVSETIVNGARDRYASEIGTSEMIRQMRQSAMVQPKTYKLPKTVRRQRSGVGVTLLQRIKKLFGFER